MSYTVTVKTKSGNGLPIKTLIATLIKYGFELVESVTWIEMTDRYNHYQVTMHESCNPEIEAFGR